ncbi:unnamed protein product [Protopolystoma xenopodis]|uniref:Uncharacterized protein n=1 Tax=Protopolystoma xenopodis TaxID=117903 RepID=A0A3S5AMX7_9PLAT|nr:unnamed protein product [Protopolystoma xenopodis]
MALGGLYCYMGLNSLTIYFSHVYLLCGFHTHPSSSGNWRQTQASIVDRQPPLGTQKTHLAFPRLRPSTSTHPSWLVEENLGQTVNFSPRSRNPQANLSPASSRLRHIPAYSPTVATLSLSNSLVTIRLLNTPEVFTIGPRVHVCAPARVGDSGSHDIIN